MKKLTSLFVLAVLLSGGMLMAARPAQAATGVTIRARLLAQLQLLEQRIGAMSEASVITALPRGIEKRLANGKFLPPGIARRLFRGRLERVSPTDTVAPKIYDLNTAITATGAQLIFRTNESATASVRYGTATPPSDYNGLVITASGNGTEHNVQITNPLSDTRYFYVITATDSAGNTTSTAVGEFRTAPTTRTDITAPRLGVITAMHVIPDVLRVMWHTDEAADGRIWTGKTETVDTSGEPIQSSTQMSVNHELLIPGVMPNTTYYFVIASRDPSGNVSFSSLGKFHTPSI